MYKLDIHLEYNLELGQTHDNSTIERDIVTKKINDRKRHSNKGNQR